MYFLYIKPFIRLFKIVNFSIDFRFQVKGVKFDCNFFIKSLYLILEAIMFRLFIYLIQNVLLYFLFIKPFIRLFKTVNFSINLCFQVKGVKFDCNFFIQSLYLIMEAIMFRLFILQTIFGIIFEKFGLVISNLNKNLEFFLVLPILKLKTRFNNKNSNDLS